MGNSLASVIFPLFCIFYILTTLEFGAGQEECVVSKCKDHGPEIRFPFWLKDHQPDHCGYPGFSLSCSKQNDTLLNLALSVKLFVQKIDYVYQVIHVFDPDGCLPRQLPMLNLSASPFQYEGKYLYNFILFNCPSADRDLDGLIPCLSIYGYQVYAIQPSDNIEDLPLLSCKRTGSIALVPYDVFDHNLQLSWSKPQCGYCEAAGKRCRLKNSTEPETECFEIRKPPHNAKGAFAAKLKITGMVLGSLLLVLIAIGLYHVYSTDKTEKENQAKIEKFLEDYTALKPSRYSYADMKRITNQFKDKLGQGGYGTVFKGKLSNEILVAVKILNNAKGNGEEFLNEVGTMGRIHHINVVRLVGFCADGFRRALVYEFLPNGSLDRFIFSENIKKSLGWVKLKDIALGIAKGIEYLHQGCDQRILHFDIKPHNILLDQIFNPKISDFGLAKLCSKEQSLVSMTNARGTVGYTAPEVMSRNFGSVSYKSDVYSFGMLLLDMVGGTKNIDVTVQNTSQGYFPDWIYNRLERGQAIGTGIDSDGDADVAKQLTIVGLWCIQWYPADRPSMKVVVQMLEGEVDSLTMPLNPFASTNPVNTSANSKHGRTFSIELADISESE